MFILQLGTPFGTPLMQVLEGFMARRKGRNQPDSFSIDELIKSNLMSNPYKDKVGGWFDQVLSPGYQAYSPEYKEQLYQTRSRDLVENVFKPQEQRFAARLAQSGLSGSGVAGDAWIKEVMTPQNRILSDLKSAIEQENVNLTRADIGQALGLYPQLDPLQNLFRYKGLLSTDKGLELQADALKHQIDAEKSKGLGNFLGLIIDALLPW